ncbi:hypothetical protein ABT340_01515 [Streptosporangium sp. NPDC000239]
MERDWQTGGTGALRSHGLTSLPRLGERQLAVLEQELVKGPVWHGWPDQR